MMSTGGKGPKLAEYVVSFDRLAKRLYYYPRPVIAAVNSHAIAGGMILASACDIRVSDGRGKFGMNEVVNGFTVPFNSINIVADSMPPKVRKAARVCAAIPPLKLSSVSPLDDLSSARHVFLRGALESAARMHALGFLDEIVPQGRQCLLIN